MQFNLAHVPFSRFGSYMAIDNLSANERRTAGIYVCTLHGDAPHAEIFRIDLLSDKPIGAGDILAAPNLLQLVHDKDDIQICFANENSVRMRGTGAGLRLSFDVALYDCAIAWRDGWLVNSFSNRMRYALFVGSGVVTCADLDEDGARWIFECQPDGSGKYEIALIESLTHWSMRDEIFARNFKLCQSMVAQEFAQWLQCVPSVPEEFAAARELAAYVQWSCFVAPQGNYRRPTMLMSKHWFNAVWSWDHCFNAMALLKQNPAFAWDQLMLIFDHQNETGALPDCVSDKSIVWNFCKPPIHGWALQWMLRHGEITDAQLQEIYDPLARWTQWWFDERLDFQDRKIGDDLPHYFHGNDSGWDNATVFDAGLPVQSPDLAAFLVLQMEALAKIAQRLNLSQDMKKWQQKADVLLEKLLAHFWLDRRFVALHDGKPCGVDSLLSIIPIALGERLSTSIHRELISILKHHFLTEHGLASESTVSPFYESNGYWRGPMWAPAVFIIVEGLRAIGEKEFADDIALRFCRTVARSGMAENFDAMTGDGLCDRAHTWTASVFLLLAHSLQKNPTG